MSTSERDKDLWKLRQLTKAKNELFTYPCSQEEAAAVRGSARFVALQAEFDALFQKYGNNPSIFKDNERAGSKRGVTKKIRAAVNRGAKRSEKQKQRTEAAKQLEQEDAQSGPRD